MFPINKSVIKNKPWQFHWLIYGQPKIGKSTFVSQFNDPLFLATEDRLGGLSVYKMPEKGAIKTWCEFILICNEITTAIDKDKFQWKTIVIDTVDILIQLCTDYVCQKQQMQHPSDKEYGKGWALVYQEFFRVINHLSSLGKGIVFISHHDEKTVKTRTMEITKIMPSVSGKVGKALIAMVDIVAHIGFDKNDVEKRVIYLRGNECLEAGDTTGILDPIMNFDYSEISKKFDKMKSKEKEKIKAEPKVTKKEEIDNDDAKGIKEDSLVDKEDTSSDFDFGEDGKAVKKDKSNDGYLESIKACKKLEDLQKVWSIIRESKEELEKDGKLLDLMLAKDMRKKELTNG